jgi:hypothetical protein
MEPDIWYATSEDYPPRKTEEEAEQVAGAKALTERFGRLNRLHQVRRLVKGEGR